MTKIKNLVATSKGASLVEYGILVGLIAVGAILAVSQLGGSIRELFVTVGSQLDGAVASAVASQGA